MKYREAKKLLPGDVVFPINSHQRLVVVDVEVFGQYKKCKVNCTLEDQPSSHISLFNEEIR